MRTAILSLSLVASLLVLAFAPVVRAGLEGAIPDATAYTTQRKLVRLSDGSIAVAYVVQRSGTNHVQVARSIDGITWTSLNPPSLGNLTADRPSLAVDSRDVLHLSWTESTPVDRQVFYASYSSGRWSAVERVSQTSYYSGFPSLAIDSRDRVHVAWYGYDGVYYQIYYRMRDAPGWGPQRAVTSATVDATNPALVLDGRDGVHVVWYHLNARGTGFEVSYAYVSGGGISYETLSASGDDAKDPTTAVDGAGRVVVAWASSERGVLRIAWSYLENGAWSPPEPLTSLNGSASQPSLSVDAFGTLYVFYKAGDGQIYVQRRSLAAWGPAQKITTGGQNSFPSARWSLYPLRPSTKDSLVDVIWTESSGGANALRFASLRSGGEVQPIPGIELTDFLFFGGLGLILIALAWVGRRPR